MFVLFFITVLILSGCGIESRGTTLENQVLPTPTAYLEIGPNDLEPLELVSTLLWSADTLLVAERRTGEVWSLALEGSQIQLEPRVRFPSSVRISALGRSNRDLVVLTHDFRLYRFSGLDEGKYNITQLVRPPGSYQVEAVWAGDDHFAILVDELNKTGISSIVLLASLDSTELETLPLFIRGPSNDLAAVQWDMVSLTASRDTLFISGASPARITAIPISNGAWHDPVTIPLEVLPRKIPSSVRREYMRAARAIGVPQAIPSMPKSFPVPIATQLVPGGLAVVALTEHQVGDGKALDLYCHGRYRETLISSPDVVDIHLTEKSALVYRAVSDTLYRLELHDLIPLAGSCPDGY